MTNQQIRKIYIFLIIIGLCFPYSSLGGYFPIFLFIIMQLLEIIIVHPINLDTLTGIFEDIRGFWVLLFFISLWAGPILILTNREIILSRTKQWLRFNRIAIPIFVINLISNGIFILEGGIKVGYGYWGYVFIIFLGGVIEVYSYLRAKKEGFLQGIK